VAIVAEKAEAEWIAWIEGVDAALDPYRSVRARSTDFGQVECESEPMPAVRKLAFNLGLVVPY
jgi:hypothetical protein